MLWVLLRIEYLSWEQGFFGLMTAEGTRGEPGTTILRLEHLMRRFLAFRDEIVGLLVPVHLIRPAILDARSLNRALFRTAQLNMRLWPFLAMPLVLWWAETLTMSIRVSIG